MKPFNEDLNKDIKQLKILYSIKDKNPFNIMKQEIMQKHNISRATLYRELKKQEPGLYKTPNYSPPQRMICEPEILMAQELLLQYRPVQDIIRILEIELGISYNWDRFNKVRQIIEERAKTDKTFAAGKFRSAFGVNGRWFLVNAFNTFYMSEDTYCTVSFHGRDIKISRKGWDDIILILQRENPDPKESRETKKIREDFTLKEKLRMTTERTINAASRGNIALSPHALKTLNEVAEKNLMDADLQERKRKFLLTGDIEELNVKTGYERDRETSALKELARQSREIEIAEMNARMEAKEKVKELAKKKLKEEMKMKFKKQFENEELTKTGGGENKAVNTVPEI